AAGPRPLHRRPWLRPPPGRRNLRATLARQVRTCGAGSPRQRHARPAPPGLGPVAVHQRRVRLRRAAAAVHDRQLDHAQQAQPRRGRTHARHLRQRRRRQGRARAPAVAALRLPPRPPGLQGRPVPRLRQGHPGPRAAPRPPAPHALERRGHASRPRPLHVRHRPRRRPRPPGRPVPRRLPPDRRPRPLGRRRPRSQPRRPRLPRRPGGPPAGGAPATARLGLRGPRSPARGSRAGATVAAQSAAGAPATERRAYSRERGMKRLLVIVLACCATAGCVSNPWTMRSRAKLPPPHDIAVFMDGTANDFESRTNVMKLNLFLSEDAGDTVDTFYVEGIGAKDKLVGAATGWGFRYRIKQAYAYLLMNHHERDRVFLFGFSRGAYSARVLASLLHYGGLPVEPVAKEARARQIADVLFDAYKGDISDELRRKRIAAAQARLGLEFRPATVEFMGLWDTVESMGLPDEGENVEGENRQ